MRRSKRWSRLKFFENAEEKKNRFAESMIKNRNENTMVLNPKTPVYVNGINRYTEREISLVEVDRLRTEKVKEDAEVSWTLYLVAGQNLLLHPVTRTGASRTEWQVMECENGTVPLAGGRASVMSGLSLGVSECKCIESPMCPE